MGTDLCTPLSVTIISPEPGVVHGTMDDLILELATRMPTSLQPPFSAGHEHLQHRRGGDEPRTIADCKPYSDSGYTLVHIPVTDLMVGTDTLVVTVKDSCGYRTQTAVSVLERTYPENDDDGDGFADGPSPMQIATMTTSGSTHRRLR